MDLRTAILSAFSRQFQVSGQVSLRIQQLYVSCETKTRDNVFVTVVVSVQYYVTDATEENIKLAFYKLSNPTSQITSYVFDVIRSEVPKLILDDTFAQKDELAIAVKVRRNDGHVYVTEQALGLRSRL